MPRSESLRPGSRYVQCAMIASRVTLAPIDAAPTMGYLKSALLSTVKLRGQSSAGGAAHAMFGKSFSSFSWYACDGPTVSTKHSVTLKPLDRTSRMSMAVASCD